MGDREELKRARESPELGDIVIRKIELLDIFELHDLRLLLF